ncbi:MAG: DUF1849 family protein [Alphaproteobacteria bacterium]
MAAAIYAQAAMADEIRGKAESLGFRPHKALYDIKLAGARSGSQILNISGQMLYEWQPSCEAWTTNHRFNILYEYADSAPMRITSNFSTYETFDGQSLSFTSQRKRDGEVFEEMRGSAAMTAGLTGNAQFTIPAELEFDLPEGTLFPVAHSIAVAEKIKEGKKFYNAPIFDGSDEEGPVSVNAFIGKPVTPAQLESPPSKALDKALLESPARAVRLAFFPLSDQEAASDYEMNLVFHENGLISDMLIEYDDFSISQTLIAVEAVEDGCNRGQFND